MMVFVRQKATLYWKDRGLIIETFLFFQATVSKTGEILNSQALNPISAWKTTSPVLHIQVCEQDLENTTALVLFFLLFFQFVAPEEDVCNLIIFNV